MGLGGGRFEVYVASSRFPEQVYQKLLLDKYFRQPNVVYHKSHIFCCLCYTISDVKRLPNANKSILVPSFSTVPTKHRAQQLMTHLGQLLPQSLHHVVHFRFTSSDNFHFKVCNLPS